MKKIITIIIVLVVIVLIIVLANKKPADTMPVDQTPVETASSSPVSLSGVTIPNGSYIVASSSDAMITWTGRKVVLKNWVDKGTIGLKDVVFEINDGKLVENSFVIDMTSIKGQSTGAGSGQDKLTTHLKSADFFDVEKFPTATFVAKEFTASSSTTFIARGDLTIKGNTHEISIPVMFDTSKAGVVSVKGSVDIDRTIWDVKYGSGKFFQGLGDNVIDDMFNLSFDLKLKPEVVASTTPGQI